MKTAVLTGAGLAVLYTGAISVADGITKLVAAEYAAPQLFAISSALVIAMSLAAARGSGQSLRIRARRPMALRAGLTVAASLGFFQAFALLPFADVFVFIALMPLMSAALSGPVLGERVRPLAWVALAIGAAGLLCLVPVGHLAPGAGHIWALFAVLSGTGSLLLARLISRTERAPLAQVFWPNLAVMVVMGAALPFVWKPVAAGDLIWFLGYAAALFAARWLSVEALRLLPAHIATPVMNLKFLWMVAIGWWGFGEMPTTGTVLGALLVIGSGLLLVADEALPMRRAAA